MPVTLTLRYLTRSAHAVCWTDDRDYSKPQSQLETIWIPNSVTEAVIVKQCTKVHAFTLPPAWGVTDRTKRAKHNTICEIEIATWFAQKEGLDE